MLFGQPGRATTTVVAITIAIIIAIPAFEAIFALVTILPVPAAVVFGNRRSRKAQNRAGSDQYQ